MPGFGWRAGLWVQLASGLAPRWGATGSLGPRGGPGKAAFCCQHLEDFSLVPRKSRYRLARANPPPSTVGYPGSCAEPGFPLQLSSEWAPRRGEKAPRGQVVSRAKRHFVCFSAVCALKLFQSHSGNPCTPSAPLGPSPSASSPAHVGGVVWTGGCGLQARESVSKLWPCTGWVWFKAVGLN